MSQKSLFSSQKPSPTVHADLWHNSYSNTKLLGCLGCPDHGVCKGLAIPASMMDCQALCCGNPEKCDRPCRNNVKDFAFRVREIGGFDLGNTTRASFLQIPTLPTVVPVVYHGKNFHRLIEAEAVAIPLFQLFSRRDGKLRFKSKEELYKAYSLSDRTVVIATGTDEDAPLERFWSQEKRRVEIAAALAQQGVMLATTPNFSVFNDVPRQVDLHAMKRIALVGSEFMNAGLPTALHVNGRTDGDFERWGEFLVNRPEYHVIAYEFTTGAGRVQRSHQHVEWLCKLADGLGRPMSLVLRAGYDHLQDFADHFDRVIVLETTSFHKAVNRRVAEATNGEKLRWKFSPTPLGEGVDELFAENTHAVKVWLESKYQKPKAQNQLKRAA